MNVLVLINCDVVWGRVWAEVGYPYTGGSVASEANDGGADTAGVLCWAAHWGATFRSPWVGACIVITSGVIFPLLAIPLSVVGHATVCGPVCSSYMWDIHLRIRPGCLVLRL